MDRDSFIFCYEGGRWREFIIAAAAAGSRCMWNNRIQDAVDVL